MAVRAKDIGECLGPGSGDWVWGKDHTPRKPEAELAKWGPDSSLHLPWKETQTRGRGGEMQDSGPSAPHPTPQLLRCTGHRKC